MTNDELDQWLAEHLMGWVLRDGYWYEEGEWTGYIDQSHFLKTLGEDREIWQPTRNIEQAMMVLEKVKPICDDIQCNWYKYYTPRDRAQWSVSLINREDEWGEGSLIAFAGAVADTLEEALCKAAREAWKGSDANASRP